MSDLHRPKKIFTFLVWGGWYGSRNIGDSAILLGVKDLIKKANPRKEYYIRALTTDPDYTATKGVTPMKALLKKDIINPVRWFQILKTFWDVDFVIISGGTPIFDHSHLVRTLYFFLPVIFRKPFILFGAGVKKIYNRYGKFYIPFVLNKAKYKSVRDSGSLEELNKLGVQSVEFTADSAFFAPPASESELEEVLNRNGLKLKEKKLIVSPRFLSKEQKRLYLEEKMSDDVIESTPVKLAKAIDAISSKVDKVVFMAMHFYGPDSDLPLIREVLGKCKSKNIVFIDEELRPDVAIALFKNAYLLLGMRLHAVLLSSSMETPVVSIAYEKKVVDLMERLELSDYNLDLFNFTEKELIAVLQKAFTNRAKTAKHLGVRVNQLRNLILKNSKTVLSVNG
ncbi:polysaccharide pyruvyl transferase family protein [Leptospira sp. SA-E8]|uniref:polysaccharide pyruvyl transferase family protein n=1 Tax=Leptospira sp. SA-E8 TaxID=3422259 RepID=UPI003EB87786